MSNPYSSQTISNYNTSPPPDDGSQVASNEITWAGIKSKLTDPIKTLAEAINTTASSAFLAVQSAIDAIVTTANVFTADQTIRSNDASSGAGPLLTLDRNSASPAANDSLANVIVSGRDSAGNTTTYAYLRSFLLDPTDGSEDGDLRIGTIVAGTSTDRLTVGQGVTVGAPTGSDKGTGSLNAVQLYEAGSRVMTKADSLAPKAWGKISQSAGTYSITTGANLGSVSKTATGDITLSWSTAFSSANYGVQVTLVHTTGVLIPRITSLLAASVSIQVTDNGGTLTDPTAILITAFGVQ